MTHPAGVEISSVRIASTSGAVSVVAEPGLDVIESGRRPIEIDGTTATVNSTHQRAEIRVPEGMDLVIGTTSGRVEVTGRVGSVAVVTVSGKVSIDHADAVDVRTESGRVTIERSDGECRVVSWSGRVEIGHCGPAEITSTSGRIVLSNVDGDSHAHCTSGRIEITMASASDVDAETVSGKIAISYPSGTRPQINTSAAGTIAVAGDHDCVVTARSGTGRVSVTTR